MNMKFQLTIVLGLLLFFIAPGPEAFAGVGINGSNKKEITSKKEIKKEAKIPKKQARLDKRLDRLAKFVSRTTGMDEAKYKSLSEGARIGIIVGAILFTGLLIGLLIFALSTLDFNLTTG